MDSAQLGFTKPPALFLDGTGLLAPSLEVPILTCDLLTCWPGGKLRHVQSLGSTPKSQPMGNKSRTSLPPPRECWVPQLCGRVRDTDPGGRRPGASMGLALSRRAGQSWEGGMQGSPESSLDTVTSQELPSGSQSKVHRVRRVSCERKRVWGGPGHEKQVQQGPDAASPTP